MERKFASTFRFRRNVEIKNRILMAPMATNMSFFDGTPTKDELEYFALHSGDVGAIITGCTTVSENGKAWPGGLSASSDQHIDGLSKIAAAIHQRGTKAILQLFHAGRFTNSSTIGGMPIVSASSIPMEEGMEIQKALSEEEAEGIIADFGNAVRRAILAGFDGVELHGANNYLIQQFYSPHSNRREDRFGGSREKRFTFIDELVDTVTDIVEKEKPEGFIIGYRFSPEEGTLPGISFDDTLYMVDRLSEKKLDYLHMSLLDHEKRSHDARYQEKTILEYVHETIAGRVPLIGVGDIRTSADLEDVLSHAELATVGRALLIDPKWAGKILNGQEEEIDTILSEYEKDEKMVSNGAWFFLEAMMKERLVYRKK